MACAQKRLFVGLIYFIMSIFVVGGAHLREAQAQLKAADIVVWEGAQSGLEYHYPPRFEPAIQRLEGVAKPLLSSLEERLGLEDLSDIEVWLLPDLAMYFELQGSEYHPASWAVGLSLSDRSTILVKHGVSMSGEIVDIEATFAHELAHVAVDRARAGEHVPRWFNEGFSVLYAEQWSPERSEALTKAGSTGSLIPFSALDTNFPPHHMRVSLAYSQSAHFVRWIEERQGPKIFAETFAALRSGEVFEAAFESVSGESLVEIEQIWRDEVESQSSFWAILKDETIIFFGAALLLLIGFVQTLRRRRSGRLAASEEDGAPIYDPARYPLPGQS